MEKPVRIELRRGGEAETEEVSNHLAYAHQVDAFADAIESTVPFPAPGEEGLRNQLVLEAAYRSLQSGKTVVVESG